MITNRIAFIVVVDDYHDIDMIAKSIIGIELSSRELGTTYKRKKYVGVIFEGASPGDGEVQDLLNKAKIKLNKD